MLFYFLFFLNMSIYSAPGIELASTTGCTVFADTLDIGKIKDGGSRSINVIFTNPGDKDLEISDIRSTCPCFKIRMITPLLVAGMKKGVFRLTVITEDLEPVFLKKIYIHTNIPENEICSIFVRGEIIK
ncbi:MAG: DUF1573 domain-containing protein [Candidatus Coatesbacteria bacterium]|nr:DUF1573 domain-containing protein [Candidatus Coatesbacteria bacterium]